MSKDTKAMVAAMQAHTDAVLAAPRKPRPLDKTALSYWFPLIQAAGVPVPKTTISLMPEEAQASIWASFDGKDWTEEETKALRKFIIHLDDISNQVGGYPLFLRTDHTSGKHQWEKTCFVTSSNVLAQHISEIAMFSECCDLIGLPWGTWVMREYLPIIPHGVCRHYGNMPVCREFRFFVDDGVIRCRHPYWPTHALGQGGLNMALSQYENLCTPPTDEDTATIDRLAQQAGKAVGGSWSIDILETERGWFVTDMAEANKSFHWEGCEKAD